MSYANPEQIMWQEPSRSGPVVISSGAAPWQSAQPYRQPYPYTTVTMKEDGISTRAKTHPCTVASVIIFGLFALMAFVWVAITWASLESVKQSLQSNFPGFT